MRGMALPYQFSFTPYHPYQEKEKEEGKGMRVGEAEAGAGRRGQAAAGPLTVARRDAACGQLARQGRGTPLKSCAPTSSRTPGAVGDTGKHLGNTCAPRGRYAEFEA